MGVDMANIREEHAMVQAEAESRAVEAIAGRYGTVSYKQGHRRGFWDGVQFAHENLAYEPPTDDEREALATVLDEIHDGCVTEGGCEFRGWQRGYQPGDPGKPSRHVDALIASAPWRNRHRGPITDEAVEAAHRIISVPGHLVAPAVVRKALEAAEAAR